MLNEVSEIAAELELSEEEARAAHLSLELAALLGPPIVAEEWRTACELCGVVASELLVEALIQRGKASRDAAGWRLEDACLADALRAHVEAEGTWRSHHATCAHALFLFSDEPPANEGSASRTSRRVTHLLEAGQKEEALVPLLQAEKGAYGNGEYEKAQGYLDVREQLLDELGAAPDDPRRGQNDWRRAQLLQVSGQRVRALELAARSRQILGRTDWASERGHAALLHGKMLCDEGRFDEARRCFEDAVREYGAAGDVFGLASSRMNRGYLEMEYGHMESAREYFVRALRSFEQLGDSFRIAHLLDYIAYTWLVEGELEEAMHFARRSRQIAREGNHKPVEAAAWNILGGIARRDGDWDEARSCFEQAHDLWRSANDRNQHIARYNLAIVEIGAGGYVAANELLVAVCEGFAEIGLEPRLPLVHTALMVCAAGEADWETFEHYHALAIDGLGHVGLGDSDMAWLLDKAVEIAAEQGHRRGQELAESLAAKVSRLKEDAR